MGMVSQEDVDTGSFEGWTLFFFFHLDPRKNILRSFFFFVCVWLDMVRFRCSEKRYETGKKKNVGRFRKEMERGRAHGFRSAFRRRVDLRRKDRYREGYSSRFIRFALEPKEFAEHLGQVTAGVVALRTATRWFRRGDSKQRGKEGMEEKEKWTKLVVSLFVDVVGWSSYVLPALGEGEDAIWAPVSAAVVQAMYGNKLLTAVDFLEEALPFTDALPTATIGWAIEYTPVGNVIPGGRKGRRKEREKDSNGTDIQ